MDYTTDYSYSTSSTLDGTAGMVALLIGIPLAILMIVSMWKVFQKAGRPGWAAIVPIYNSWVYFEIAGKPGWWSLLTLGGIVPLLGIVAGIAYFVLFIIASLEVAKRFGKSTAFGVLGLVLFPFVGLPMLAFGKDTYKGGSAPTPPAAPATPPAAPANPTA
jgi:hypothetical protein